MSFQDFVKKNWKDVLGGVGAVGKVVLFIVSKVGSLSSSYWIGFASIFWLFILVWAVLTLRKARGIFRAFVIVAVLVSGGSLGYFLTVGFVYFFCDVPPSIGQTYKTEKDTVTLTASGISENAFNENYELAFSESADYVETDFTVSPQQYNTVRELLITYDDLPKYKDKVRRSNTTVKIKSVEKGFSVWINIAAELNERTENPKIIVNVEKRFANRNRWWRLKRWVFERYRD